jgi:hypothetical protein
MISTREIFVDKEINEMIESVQRSFRNQEILLKAEQFKIRAQ